MRAFLITIGVFGAFIAIPSSIFAAMMHHGFGGEFTLRDWLVLLSPLLCVTVIFLGIAIKPKSDA
jgi:hypothetical protein